MSQKNAFYWDKPKSGNIVYTDKIWLRRRREPTAEFPFILAES